MPDYLKREESDIQAVPLDAHPDCLSTGECRTFQLTGDFSCGRFRVKCHQLLNAEKKENPVAMRDDLREQIQKFESDLTALKNRHPDWFTEEKPVEHSKVLDVFREIVDGKALAASSDADKIDETTEAAEPPKNSDAETYPGLF